VERKTFLGVFAGILIFLLGFFLNGKVALYFNLVSLLIVAGGVMGAAFISFRWERLKIVCRVLRSLYATKVRTPEEIVEALVDLSVKCKINGILALDDGYEDDSVNFLKRALELLIDGYPKEQIRDTLTTEMYFFKLRRQESERVLRTIAEICPPFGLIGSIVGLLGLFSSGYQDASLLQTIATALTSTIYGAILAYFLFIPFAAQIRERTDNELLLQKIILEGVIAIESGLKPRVLEMKLKSFLTPSSRKNRIISLERIKARFRIKDEEDKLQADEERVSAK
jgi:chemotaxis protein MotA